MPKGADGAGDQLREQPTEQPTEQPREQHGVVKPTPTELMHPIGDGLNFETRWTAHPGFLTPTDRFFVRNHTPTPRIDAHSWRLRINGSGVQRAAELSYDQLLALPQVSLTRTIECAGNGRRFFAEHFDRPIKGTPWRTGAMGTADWAGVPLRDVLAVAGVISGARDVLPEGLDEPRFGRPMPIEKALADDTILALTMNGEPLPPDHGFPARIVASGWVGAASIKWVGRIEVSAEPLYTHWNTHDYVLAGPDYAAVGPADGPPITVMPPMSVVDLDWPATLRPGRHLVRGRAYSGAGQIVAVEVRIDDGDWRPALLRGPRIDGAWVQWELPWEAAPGEHRIHVRATDAAGRTQPDHVPWNDHGCLYHAVVAHPVTVTGQDSQAPAR